jgi:hypothetical protein
LAHFLKRNGPKQPENRFSCCFWPFWGHGSTPKWTQKGMQRSVLGLYRPFGSVSDSLGLFRTVSEHFGLFRNDLDHFVTFWTILHRLNCFRL